MSRWLDEPLGDGLTRRWRLDEVLWEGRTDYQHVVVARTAHGVTLFCDGERQSAELSQLVYHEALLVPALLLATAVDRVLVIGSSEGVVSELAVAAGASVVDHVDIDRECVRRCAELLPYGYTPASLAAAERGDGPVRVHYADGWAFVHDTPDRYDVVVVDLPDERGDGAQHDRLYSADFLARCRDLLTPGGVVAAQAGCPTLWRNATLATALDRFHAVFGAVTYYGSDEHEWAFLFGSERARPLSDGVTAYRPVSIDADALRAGTTPPRALRCR
ncbi:MAG TPA: spermidine synthase [Pseudonocardiaceae bacterium]